MLSLVATLFAAPMTTPGRRFPSPQAGSSAALAGTGAVVGTVPPLVTPRMSSTALTRRALCTMGAGTALTLSACGLRSSGGPTPTPTPTPSCTPSRARLDEIGVAVPVLGCAAPQRHQYAPGKAGGDPVPHWVLGKYSVYLLPDTFRAQTQTPINGRHGFFRSPDQLVEGRDPGWDDGKRISYGAHRYEE